MMTHPLRDPAPAVMRGSRILRAISMVLDAATTCGRKISALSNLSPMTSIPFPSPSPMISATEMLASMAFWVASWTSFMSQVSTDFFRSARISSLLISCSSFFSDRSQRLLRACIMNLRGHYLMFTVIRFVLYLNFMFFEKVCRLCYFNVSTKRRQLDII